jgi:hypothetical protein
LLDVPTSKSLARAKVSAIMAMSMLARVLSITSAKIH